MGIQGVYRGIDWYTRVYRGIQGYTGVYKGRSPSPGSKSPFRPYKTTFARTFLFSETAGLLDLRALYAIQYNI